MRQVVIPRFGDVDVLRLQDAPSLPLDPEAVRIRVRAAGVNFADVLGRMGLYPDAPKPPFVPGYEVAGVVEECGASVKHLRTGHRVVALTKFGGYASEVVVPAARAFALPEQIGDLEAAALPVNFLTALIALHKMANVSAGETVLIHGAGGGVGIAAIQIARLRQALIIGTASAAKHDAIRALGVDHAIDYRTSDVVTEVRRLTDGRGVDVVLDPIGGASFGTSYRLLAPLGRLVIYGVSSIAPGRRRSWWHAGRTMLQMRSFKPLSLINRNRGVFGLNLAHLWSEQRQLGAAMDLLLEETFAGRVKPVIAKVFPLEAAADAHRFLQERANIGKVILTNGV